MNVTAETTAGHVFACHACPTRARTLTEASGHVRDLAGQSRIPHAMLEVERDADRGTGWASKGKRIVYFAGGEVLVDWMRWDPDTRTVRPARAIETESSSPSGPAPSPASAKARTTDPETSRAAAVAAAPRAGTQKARLLDVFRANPGGLTAQAASELADVVYVSGSTRCTELERDGLLARTGFTRETANGGEGDVLVLAPSALAASERTVAA